MARSRSGVWLLCVFFVFLRVICAEHKQADGTVHTTSTPSPEFARHAVVTPRVFHGREKREISSTREEEDGTHIHDLTVGFNVNGKDYVLDLQLNRELIPKTYFEKYQHRGRHVVNKPTGKDVQLCHYKGTLRDVPFSWVALSTCHGLSGVIFDGEEMHYLQRSSNNDHSITSPHFLYSHSDLRTNHTCGYEGTPHHVLETLENNRILRYKRDAEVIRGPYNANVMSRYVELVLVVDNKEYKELGESLSNVYHHCKEIANIINALYVPLNIFIALVGVVAWTEFDEISLVSNGDTTLTNFLHYRRERLVKEHPNDNAQLLTRTQFDGGVVGKALKGPICTYEFSGGVSMDHSNVVGLVATTVAHEMGHNFGMEHDSNDCKCPSDRCIMAPSSSSMSPTQWSSCSLDYLAHAFDHGMDYCLRNKPERLFDSPVCGNGFVEAGEQCDCGLKDRCDNPCCNATSCMLFSNASCATGECCDLKTCHPKNAGTLCRSANHECDLPEFCTGQSEYCPGDVFKMDGEMCGKGSAYCYHGSCRTHTDQCRLLWGPSGDSSGLQCYDMNTRGSRHGNCGYNRLNQSYIQCNKEHVYCGMLHCKHLNERLEFGMESVAILSHSFINTGGNIMPCRTAIVDLGLNEVDPGLAPDGAKCGDGKMCINQKCMSVGAFRKNRECPENCNGNGVCNSKGHCHCNAGFAPPLCDYPGIGGSEDSGPASDPNARRDFMTALYIIFLGIVPLLALVAMFVYYSRRNSKHWWQKRRHGNTAQSKPSEKKQSPSRSNPRNQVPIRISSPARHNTNVSSPITPGTESDHASLLHGDANGVPPGFKNNFFGQFKGFTITPLQSSSAKTATTPTRTPSIVAPPTAPVLTRSPSNIPSKKINGTPKDATDKSVHPFPPITDSLPTTQRPIISSPILDTTTCTAKEVLTSVSTAQSVPARPAPSIPSSQMSTNVQKPVRPLSSPNSLNVTSLVDDKKDKENGQNYPTLTKLASLMLRQASQNSTGDKNKEKEKVKNKIISDGTHSLPRKANKLLVDRDSLRNLTISNPIPQQNIEIPSSAIPVKTEDDSEKQIVMRAQSLRDTGPVIKRPLIQTFGSMRQSTKRPTSIPAGTRPTSPPPRPPDVCSKPEELVTGILGMPGYQTPHSSTQNDYGYDDCLNLLTEGSAPLANIDEETSPTTGDNIYAVIEESPSEIQRRRVQSKNTNGNSNNSKYASPTFNDYKTPKPVEGSTSSGSIESVGLLSEIVNEIQNRNLESIYSTSTLGRKKKKDGSDDTESVMTDSSIAGSTAPSVLSGKASTVASSESSSGTYVNAPYPSSNIYGGSSVYSNFSTLTNPSSSPVSTSRSSASSASGYLSPTVLSSTHRHPSSQQPPNSTPNSKAFTTFRNQSQPDTHLKDIPAVKLSGLSSEKSDKFLNNIPSAEAMKAPYKPYSSSLQRSAGPLASMFKSQPVATVPVSSNATSTFKTQTIPSVPVSSNVPTVSKDISAGKVNTSSVPVHGTNPKPATSIANAQINNKITNSSAIERTTLDNSSKGPSQTKINSTFSKPVTKPSPSVPVAKAASTSSTSGTATSNTQVTGTNITVPTVNNSNQRPKVAAHQMSLNSPDVVSSCSNSNSEKTPDIINSKVSSSKSPDAVVGSTVKPPANSAAPGKSNVSVSRSNSARPAPSIASKPSSINSSFRNNNTSGKQPQTAPKPSKPNISGTNNSNALPDKTKSISGVTSNKDPANKTTAGRGTSISKSVSDVGGSKAMPAGARTAASKLSHVASLQQKFETQVNNGDKGIKPVPTGVASRVKPSVKTANIRK